MFIELLCYSSRDTAITNDQYSLFDANFPGVDDVFVQAPTPDEQTEQEEEPVNTSKRINTSIDDVFEQDFSPDEQAEQEEEPVHTSKRINRQLINRSNNINVDVERTKSGHRNCVICNRKNTSAKLKLVSTEAIIDVFVKRNVLIPFTSRACQWHFQQSKLFTDEAIEQITTYDTSTRLDKRMVEELLVHLRDSSRRNTLLDRFQCTVSLDEDLCLSHTGFSVDQFIYIHDHLESMRDSFNRTKTQALAIYLFWLKTGLDQTSIAAYFNIGEQLDVSRILQQTRSALACSFVPLHLGPNARNREEWLAQNTYLANELYTTRKNQLVLIADGTYCYCQKVK